MIGTLASMLRCATLDDPTHWSSWVGDLTFEYNVSVHRATKLTPFEVHFGYRARLLRELEEVDRSQHLPEPERYVADLREKRRKVDKAVKDGLAEYYKDMRTYYDQRMRAAPHPFQVGDWVLAKRVFIRPGETKALGALYLGPAEVKEITDTSAVIEFVSNGQRRTRSVAHLKKYYGTVQGEAQRFFTGPDGDADAEVGPPTPHPFVNNDEDDDDDEEQIAPRRVRFSD